MYFQVRALCASAVLLLGLTLACGEDAEPINPKDTVIQLFNGKNFDGLYTWLQDAKYEDPRKAFTVEGGMLHISGDGMGYVCTKHRYKDYHLVVEYRWGERTWLTRKTCAKDSGLIVHCSGPDGNFAGVFMAGIEAQIIEGGTGDFILVPGKRADGSEILVSLAAETTNDRDGETVWKKEGQRTTFHAFTRINWYGRDPDWEDVLGFRGKQYLESPGKEWTRLDIICDGGHVIYRVNGIQANEGFDAVPSCGKILIQCEGAEIYIRRFELLPLKVEADAATRKSATFYASKLGDNSDGSSWQKAFHTIQAALLTVPDDQVGRSTPNINRARGGGAADPSYSIRGKVCAYVHYRQPLPEGFERLKLWPVEIFDKLAPPQPPANP